MSITFEKVSHYYGEGTIYHQEALKEINLALPQGKVIAIVGATGSGKTTLVQHLNALLLPSTGEIQVFDYHITPKEKPAHVKGLRKQVGLVFQFPEYQLFEETVLKDVSFGPKNFDVADQEALEVSRRCLTAVGIEENQFEVSPLTLSGGQKRRVAIAGILALDPRVLVLDEPTAGLDPQGSKAMMKLFLKLNQEEKKTIIMVTHDMEHVLNYCDEVIVLDEGKVISYTSTEVFFQNLELLERLKINPPQVVSLKQKLIAKGFQIDPSIIKESQLIEAILREVQDE